MFIKQTLTRNIELINTGVDLLKNGQIEPDTYVIDLDTTLANSQKILNKAKEKNIQLYFMLKQVGRNPYIAKKLMEMGYSGAVVVDYREATIMMNHGIRLGNVGHLVQTPYKNLKRIIDYGTEVITVMSLEKLIEINEVAGSLDKVQDIILKVYDFKDNQYSGQEGGVEIQELSHFIIQSQSLKHVNIVGATAFPAFLYTETSKTIEKTENYYTISKAIEIMKEHGLSIKQVNMPSTTSVKTLEIMGDTIATHGEPGHGLTGSTPMHAIEVLDEIPSVIYLSEVSHNFKVNSYAYGGGHYRRSHIENALVFEDDKHFTETKVVVPDSDSIDYYFKLLGNFKVSLPVVMAFRFQIFVTRSNVAIVEGISTGNPTLIGIFDSLGKKVEQ